MPAWSRILTLPSETKGYMTDDGLRHTEGFVSSMRKDRQREVVHQDTLLRAYEAAAGMPYFRDHSPEKAIGAVSEWEKWQDKVHIRTDLVPKATPEDNTLPRRLADDLFDLLQINTPVSQSIGFNPIDIGDWSKSGEEVNGVWWWGGEDGMKDFEMLETSAVMIGANRDADLHMAKGLGLTLDQPWLDEDAALSKEQREEKRLIEDITRATGATEAARNYVRHLQREGRALSPETLELIANPIANLAEVVRAGRVLSARNRTAVLDAIDALTDVVRRDDESRNREDANEAEAALGFLDVTLKESLLDLPLSRR